MSFALVAMAISSAEPISSRWPSAMTMPSTLGKSATFTGLSGLVTNGLVRITSPLGEVRRKIDHENHSSVTGFDDCAKALPDHKAMAHPSAAPKAPAYPLCLIASSPFMRPQRLGRAEQPSAAGDASPIHKFGRCRAGRETLPADRRPRLDPAGGAGRAV